MFIIRIWPCRLGFFSVLFWQISFFDENDRRTAADFFYSKIFLKSLDALPIKWEQCVKSEQVMILPNYNYKLSNENSEKNLNSAEIRNKRWWILRNSTNC